jgi:hypothetical protein
MEKQEAVQKKNLSLPSVLLAQMYSFFVSFIGDKRSIHLRQCSSSNLHLKHIIHHNQAHKTSPQKIFVGEPLVLSSMQANIHTPISKSDSNVAEERTPLLPSSPQGFGADKEHSTKLRLLSKLKTSERAKEERVSNLPLEPAQALTPLVSGGTIQTTDGATLTRRSRPPPLAKSIPAAPPSRLKARHKSKFLFRLNEFRHAYKNTRLALKFGGLVILANASWDKMASFSPLSHKSLGKMGKLMKRLGQGGPMRLLLVWLHPFTNTLRLSMLVLRTMESSHFYRMEVFVEESMVSESV